MNTANIVKFLQTAYTDEKLAALLAHATVEPGENPANKLSYRSCCCFIGIPSAHHALRGCLLYGSGNLDVESFHHLAVRATELGTDAEIEFAKLGETDAERRDRLVPLIEAEIARRSRIPIETPEFEQVSS